MPWQRLSHTPEVPEVVGWPCGARGLRGVYASVVPGLRPPPRSWRSLGAMRLGAARRVRRRHLINARNEGVPGSSPGVGFLSRGDSEASGPPSTPGPRAQRYRFLLFARPFADRPVPRPRAALPLTPADRLPVSFEKSSRARPAILSRPPSALFLFADFLRAGFAISSPP
jgi:hypothetical protein